MCAQVAGDENTFAGRGYGVGGAGGAAAGVGGREHRARDRADAAGAGAAARAAGESDGGLRCVPDDGGVVAGGRGDLHAGDDHQKGGLAGGVSQGGLRISAGGGAGRAGSRGGGVCAHVVDGREGDIADILPADEGGDGAGLGDVRVSVAHVGAAVVDRRGARRAAVGGVARAEDIRGVGAGVAAALPDRAGGADRSDVVGGGAGGSAGSAGGGVRGDLRSGRKVPANDANGREGRNDSDCPAGLGGGCLGRDLSLAETGARVAGCFLTCPDPW